MSKGSTKSARKSSKGSSSGRQTNSMGLNMYTEDAAGLKIDPNAVLVMSLLFVAFVIILHIQGKFRKG
eukprot:CAMPEP_0184481026 /NCGR_PEP_ID=MMETSP0113_2-20130426/2583_1 /TAXON_ID=91329 /ORGANISM="Norrisiella sphaerica, Strain BC52" /LENGTH=67 /DNA_ID=CAMNT_0026859913 /DNA_START=42 /DNA_END=245 /DNA_ORIENTATION=-